MKPQSHGYDSFVNYVNDVKIKLMEKIELTNEEAEDYAETFGDYFEDGIDPETAVETEITYLSQDTDPELEEYR